MDPPWDQMYARDVPPDFDEMRKREDRKERIKPHWDLLVRDDEPKINKAALIRLMHDLKDEGNALFKEGQYDIAWMHYRNAIFVARILDTRFYHTVDKEFLSSLFSNRAFCCLKKEMYPEAVHDCESAIKVFPNNLKAYYRQAVALKHQKRYTEAVQAAQRGQEIQPISALKELLDELLPLVKGATPGPQPTNKAPGQPPASKAPGPPPASKAPGPPPANKQPQPAGPPASKAPGHPPANKVPSQPPANKAPGPPHVNRAPGPPPAQQPTATPVRQTSAEVSARTELVRESSIEETNTSTHDNEWLAGTNITITEKHLESKGKMGRKNKSKTKKPEVNQTPKISYETNGYSGNWASDYDDDDESDDINSSLGEDDEKFASQLKGVRSEKITLGDPKPGSRSSDVLNLVHPKVACEDERAWSFPHDNDTNGDSSDVRQRYRSPIGKKTSNMEPVLSASSMGLDSFATIGLNDDFDGSETSNSSRYSSRGSQSPVKTVTGKTSTPAVAEILPDINFPLSEEFDFKIACSLCFPKIGEGRKGYRYVGTSHSCIKNVLIVNKKTPPGLNWIKVRPRPPSKANHYGAYKMCQQFSQDQPCKVGEPNCTFAHNAAETKLWMMDREGKFNIEDFVKKCRMNNIDSSETYERIKAKQQYIPGLNFPGNKQAKKQTLETLSSPYKQTKQNKQNKPVSQSKQAGSLPAALLPTPSLKPQITDDYRQVPPTQGPSLLGMGPGPPVLGGFPDGFSTNPFAQPPPLLPNQMNTQISRQSPTVFQSSDIPAAEQMAKIENPLAPSHEFKMVCQDCMHTPLPGYYEYNPAPHKCEENMLAMRVRVRGAPWVRVRERKNHREFPGNYLLCRCISFKDPIFCKYGEEQCSFAHNDVEQRLWTLEKDGLFNVTEFIMQNRKMINLKGFSLKEILVKHGGFFEFICRSCYYSTPPKIAKQGSETECNGKPPHSWIDFKILAHIGPGGVVTLINPRGFLHKSAFFKICKWLHFCRTRVNAECRFAHSVVERDVWMLERDVGLSREEIVKQSKQVQNIMLPSSSGATQTAQTTGSTPTGSSGWAAVAGSGSQSTNTQKADNTTETSAPDDNLCPVTIVEVCQTCWKNGQKTMQDGEKDRCLKHHANWTHNRAFLISPSYKELRPLPRKIPSGLNFIVCKNVREKGKCGYTGICQFAHCTEELEAWKWMCMNGIHHIEQVAEASKAAQKLRAESVKPKISGQSVVSVGQAPSSRPTLPVGNIYTYYCHYCGVSCNSQKQWDEHRASDKHNFNVDSDKEHQWNYRQPPWNKAGRYQLCAKHLDGNKCQYSSMPEMYNLCTDAHSQEELDEWKERFEWRQMKREMARQEQVFSYMDQLREKYEASQSSVKVISESVEGVTVSEDGDLHIYKEDKRSNHTWTFMLKTELTLQKVALLYNRDRLHFSLVGAEKQIAQGDAFAVPDPSGQRSYKIRLQFTGGMFGSFQQWVIFDFGQEPVLSKKITVEVGNQDAHLKVKKLREQLTFDRWTSQNRVIVRHDIDCNHPLEGTLLTKYKEPSSSETVVTQTTILTELNRHNYRQKMHKLLELEEMTRHQIISSYNLCTAIDCLDTIQEEAFVFARPGELFAKVPLQEHLTEDTDAGKLILSSVRNVLVAPLDRSDNVVYEAAIVREENFNYDGRGREYIYLCLSPKCVQQLKIKKGMSVNVEIQFQMDRLFFSRMHYAIDELGSPDIVFPDVPKINPLRNEKHNLTIRSQILNPDQMEAVKHIVAERTGYTPPFVIYGPFGTGKTETLAQAAMVLLKEKPETRILICAQSNSAADLYIVKHLDTFLKKNKVTLRRIYFKERRVYTVDQKVKNYCLLSQDQSSFETPTREDIINHRIVIVTVNTALVLFGMGLQGHFTHIFIDEAAQSLECEALMPLALATEKTCIVLAGDHEQISPKVYSSEARNQKLHVSLLERLHNYYESYKSLISESSPLNILLSINYRTKMEILRFISAIFYGGPDKLKSEANIRSVVDITPLVFYGVQGREVQDVSSISYYNMSEVQEVVERVEDLYNRWPEEWGERSAKEIGVVSPYYDQVQLIRKALKKKNSDLRDVVVERIHGVQGREFRAMFLSTVRTRHLIDITHIQTDEHTECDGDGGDFGFLSDSKLLNTAFTRAQSLVVVVGDPVALCAFGDCTNVWRVYLKHCQNMRSLFPQSYTLDSIKQQVQEMMNSPNKNKLLQLANQRSQQAQMSHPQPTEQKTVTLDYRAAATKENTASDVSQHAGFGGGIQTVGPTADVLHPGLKDNTELYVVQRKPEVPPSLRNDGAQSLSVGNETATNLATRPMPIRAPLTIPGRSIPPAPLRLPVQRKLETYFGVGDHFTIDAEEVLTQLAKMAKDASKVLGPPSSNIGEEVKPENVRLAEQSGCVVVHYGKGEGNVNEAKTVQYNNDQLEQLVRFNPGKYVPCKIKVEEDEVFAEVTDTRSQARVINIDSKANCNGAMNNDDVIIEVLNIEKDCVHGKVVGVQQRAVDLEGSIICCVEEGEMNALVPINPDLPKLYNVCTASVQGNNTDGSVSVYKFTTNKQIRFSHLESVKGCSENKLFVVKFLKFDSSVQLHLCVVVGVLPAGLDITTGMTILDLEHNVVNDHQPESNLEVEHTYQQNYQLDAEVYQSRVDLTERWCLSIDNPLAEDTENAFSIDEIGDGSYQIGVHVSDVSHFVPKDNNVDLEARDRGLTLYPPSGEPAYMLPPRLSTEICSLRPEEDKVAVSVLMTVQPTGEVRQVSVQKSIINVKQKFTFQEADEILQDPLAHENYLKSCVLVLYEISRMWKKNRLGNASFCQDLKPDEKLSPLSHQLVSEMLIMMQYHVAQVILGKFPLACPMYCQAPPRVEKLTVWKHEHAADAVNSMALTKPFLEGNATCKCKVACTCIGKFIRQSNLKIRDTIDVICSSWDNLTQASDSDQFGYVQSVIVEAENHPQLAVAQHKLKSLENSSYYTSSANTVTNKTHYSMNLNPYTQCSKPSSRYMDLVIQRLLLACIDSTHCPYTLEEVQTLCAKVKNAEERKKMFEEAVLSLHLGLALSARPLVMQSIVEVISKDVIEVCFPSLPCLREEQSSIPISLLNPVSSIENENGGVELKWQERVYSAPGFQSSVPTSNFGELNPDRFIYKIPAKHWQRLLMAVREEDITMYQKLKAAVDFVRKQLIYPGTQGLFIEDVTSESKSRTGRLHRVSEFSLKVNPFQVIQVQLSGQMCHGLMAPMIQLVNITPNLDVCIEHHRDPVKCFTDKTLGSNNSTLQKYTDLDTYLKCWEPVLNAEAAERAVIEENRLIIRGVIMSWKSETTFDGSQKIANFSLPLSFLKERQIKLLGNMQISELFNASNSSQCQTYFADFVCVRYSNLALLDDPALSDTVSLMMNNGLPVTWVGHCVIVTVRMENDSLTFKLKLLQSSVPLPDAVSLSSGWQMPCTVELVERSCVDRSIMLSRMMLRDCSSLVKAVALGQTPTYTAYYNDIQQLKDSCRIISHPNPGQDEAFRRSLHMPFTVINGGPQSGKTMIAASLACMFAQRNKQTSKGQVLVCVPNETSLHNIIEILQNNGRSSKLKMVVVYDDNLTQKFHPLPGSVNIYRHRDPVVTESSSSLRNQIVSPASPYSQAIKEHENVFAFYPDNVTEDQVQKYLEIVSVAETLLLCEAEVVLCTCTASTSAKVMKHCNIEQIIIDDSQTCTEPETLVPLSVYKSVKQVVLLGDQSQSKPTVLSQQGKEMGLQKSLFERYLSSAVQLPVHYSVHEGIMEFVEENAEVGRLSCGNVMQRQPSILNWPGDRSKPTVFCHVEEGQESMIQGYGKQQQIVNNVEIDFVIRVAFGLVNRYQVSQNSIAIACTTLAQRDTIAKKLEKTYSNFVVCTVLDLQGKSYDYVIMSTVRWLPSSKIDRVPSSRWMRNHLGELSEKGYVTMVMTRAKKGLVVVGNQQLLRCSSVWRRVLERYTVENKLVTAEEFLKSMGM